ncbi:sigma-70 family RNA polymerase sigma factor [Candidatus Hydrogenedentota bacterium]
MTDAELIDRILSGEEELFSRIVERYTGYVWALCSTYVRNESDCGDVVQEVFIQCYRRLDTLRNRSAFTAWLGQVTRRQSLNWLKKAARRQAAMTRYAEDVRHATENKGVSADGLEREELANAIRELIDTLPPKCREAMKVYYSEEYSVVEAARFLNISRFAMKKRLSVGRKLLRERFAGELKAPLEPATRKEELAARVVAAVPFGSASWLTKAAGATATVSNITLAWGITIMWKKIALGLAAIILLFMVGRVLTDKPAERTDEDVIAKTVPEEPIKRENDSLETFAKREVSPPIPDEPEISEDDAILTSEVAPDEEEPAKQEEEAAELEPASVSGLVTDSKEVPLEGAKIYLRIGKGASVGNADKLYTATTGVDGRYTISNIDTFDNGVIHAAGWGLMTSFGKQVIIKPGARKNVDFQLWPQPPKSSFISGQVLSDEGEPIFGAQVMPRRLANSDWEAVIVLAAGNVFSSITDEEGRFYVTPLSKNGIIDLCVSREGYGTAYFAGIETGEENVTFVLNSGGAIAGRVKQADGRPAPDVEIEALGIRGEPPDNLTMGGIYTTRTNEKGAYTFDHLGEDHLYTVRVVNAFSFSIKEHSIDRLQPILAALQYEESPIAKSEVLVQAGRTTSGVDFVFDPASMTRLHGVVTDASSGVPAYPLRILLVEEGADPNDLSEARVPVTSRVAPDGSYEFTLDISETVYYNVCYQYVEFQHVDGHYITVRMEAIPATDVALEPGADKEFDFTVDGPLTIPVRLVDDEDNPVEGVRAMIKNPDLGKRAQWGGSISGPDGRTVLRGLNPQYTYEIFGGGSKHHEVQGGPGETLPELVITCRQ